MSILQIRKARRTDIPALLELMIDTAIDPRREEGATMAVYEAAFAAIDADPNQHLAVAELAGEDGIVATLQLTFIPGLSRRGGWRMQLENVRVAGRLRGRGLGAQMMAWAIDQARQRDCILVQLTTHKTRADAQRFYRQLGFEATHEGMKLVL